MVKQRMITQKNWPEESDASITSLPLILRSLGYTIFNSCFSLFTPDIVVCLVHNQDIQLYLDLISTLTTSLVFSWDALLTSFSLDG